MNGVRLSSRAGTAVWTAVLLAAVCPSPADADWCHGGERPSLEWLVDASNVVVGEVVEESGHYHYTIRVTAILKQSRQFTAKVGDVVRCKVPFRWPYPKWKKDEPTVVFFGNDTSLVRNVINLIRPEAIWNYPEDRYLTVDMHGKIVPDRDEFMRRVRTRIGKNVASDDGFSPGREDGFEYFPENCQIDGDSEYYSLRVPPDPCFRKMLEDAAQRYKHPTYPGHAIWAQSALYRYYSGLTDEERKRCRKKTVDGAREFASVMHASREGLFTVTNYYTFPNPRFWFGKVSANGRYLALRAGESVELHDLLCGETLYTGEGSYVRRGRDRSMVFASDSKHFAHLHANGDVTLCDLTGKNVKHKFEFAWEPQARMVASVCSFSPDGRYLALLVHSGDAIGSALQVWNVESGETVLKPTDDWRTRVCVQGFSHDSKLLKVEALDYDAREPKRITQVWDLETGRLVDEPVAGEWLVLDATHKSCLHLDGRPDKTPSPAETRDGKLRAEVVPGRTLRLVIRQVESKKIVRSFELADVGPVCKVLFSGRGDAIFLVTGSCNTWMLNIGEGQPRPTQFSCWH